MSRKIIHDLYRVEKARPFSWADGGCLFFPGLVAKAMTGIDPTEQIRRKFTTEAEAKRLLVKHRCRNLHDMVTKKYESIPFSFARAGDWAVVENDDGREGLGVVMGSQILVHTPQGLAAVPLLRAKSAYRVK